MKSVIVIVVVIILT